MGCAKRDKGQASRIGPQEEEKTCNSRPDPFDLCFRLHLQNIRTLDLVAFVRGLHR